MRIKFQMHGGFAAIPALAKPFIIDTQQVDPTIAGQLESYVRASSFFERPAQIGNLKRGAADYRTYTITVEDDDKMHSLQLTEPIADANLQQLVSHLRNMSQTSNLGK